MYCTGMLRKNMETDILVYGGNWVKFDKTIFSAGFNGSLVVHD